MVFTFWRFAIIVPLLDTAAWWYSEEKSESRSGRRGRRTYCDDWSRSDESKARSGLFHVVQRDGAPCVVLAQHVKEVNCVSVSIKERGERTGRGWEEGGEKMKDTGRSSWAQWSSRREPRWGRGEREVKVPEERSKEESGQELSAHYCKYATL
jgi:hypothetical protein